jgi:uracil-DNA glycosylase family 4
MARHTASNAWTNLNERIIACGLCPRLRTYCEQVAQVKKAAYRDWQYWGKPVPNFGDPSARLLIVGLAPAAHGANRTGRMFTGDRSGEWLYRALYKAGFSNQSDSNDATDSLALRDCAITAAVHCAPPGNKPLPGEVDNCRAWLDATFELVPAIVYLALGQIAWKALLVELRRRGWHQGRSPKFAHGAQVSLADGRWLMASYHPSQQNTFTGVLTEPMFDEVFRHARRRLDMGKSTSESRYPRCP